MGGCESFASCMREWTSNVTYKLTVHFSVTPHRAPSRSDSAWMAFFCLRPNLLHNRNPVLCHVLRGGNLIEKVECRKADELPSALGEGQDAAVVLEVNPGKHLIDVLRNTVIATLLPLEEYGIFGDGRNTSFPVPVAFATKLENAGLDVDFLLAWNRPHSGDYALDEVFCWIRQITGR